MSLGKKITKKFRLLFTQIHSFKARRLKLLFMSREVPKN